MSAVDRPFSRRTVAAGAAWTVPAVAVASASPVFAASICSVGPGTHVAGESNTYVRTDDDAPVFWPQYRDGGWVGAIVVRDAGDATVANKDFIHFPNYWQWDGNERGVSGYDPKSFNGITGDSSHGIPSDPPFTYASTTVAMPYTIQAGMKYRIEFTTKAGWGYASRDCVTVRTDLDLMISWDQSGANPIGEPFFQGTTRPENPNLNPADWGKAGVEGAQGADGRVLQQGSVTYGTDGSNGYCVPRDENGVATGETTGGQPLDTMTNATERQGEVVWTAPLKNSAGETVPYGTDLTVYLVGKTTQFPTYYAWTGYANDRHPAENNDDWTYFARMSCA